MQKLDCSESFFFFFSGNILNDFVVGRELAPRIGELYDLATLSFRCGLLSWVSFYALDVADQVTTVFAGPWKAHFIKNISALQCHP